MRGPFAAALPAALVPCMLHCSAGAAIRTGGSLSVLLSCTGSAAAAAAVCRLLLPSAAALPSLAAAQQLLNLRGLHCSPSCPALLQRKQLPCLPGTAAAQQLVSLRGFRCSGSQSSSSSSSSTPPALLHSAAVQTLFSLHAAQRSLHAAAGMQPPQWQQHWRGPRLASAWQRSLHSSSSSQVALGVVDKLHDELPVVLPADGRSRHFWEVLEFRPDSTVLETWKTPDVLGLHPRDVYLFASDVGIGQRAMLAARGGAILFRTEVCKSVIYHDRAVLFPCRRLSDTVRISQSVKAAVTQKASLPFELKVLEALLSETARAYANKGKRLSVVAETVLQDINNNWHSSAGELQRLIPIQRKLTEVQNDVQEVLEAIGDTVNDDSEVKKLCLTERQERTKAAIASARAGEGKLPPQLASAGGRTPEMRMGSAILESYEFKLQSTHTSLREALENIEQTRTVWHMQLDHQRNRVLRINLLISIMSLGGVMATMPAAYFGMNLSSGLEEQPNVFWPVVQGSMLLGVCASLVMWGYYKFGPKRRYRARMRDMRSLRDLLVYHLDDLDDVMEQVKERARTGLTVSKKEFKDIVQQAVRGKPMSKEEVDLLYRVFDTNKDGFLELSEMVRIEEHIDDQFSSTHF